MPFIGDLNAAKAIRKDMKIGNPSGKSGIMVKIKANPAKIRIKVIASNIFFLKALCIAAQ